MLSWPLPEAGPRLGSTPGKHIVGNPPEVSRFDGLDQVGSPETQRVLLEHRVTGYVGDDCGYFPTLGPTPSNDMQSVEGSQTHIGDQKVGGGLL